LKNPGNLRARVHMMVRAGILRRSMGLGGLTMKKIFIATSLALLAAGPAPVHADEPTTLRFGFTSPQTSYVNIYGADPWIKEVEAASQGTLKVQMYFNNVLGTVFNVYERTVTGVLDISFGTISTVAGVFTKSTVSDLPFVSQDPYEAGLALWRLNANGITADEFRQVKVLTLFTFSSSSMHTTKQIRTMEDLKGVKIGALSKVSAEAYVLLGAVPVTMAPAETYQAIQRGLVAGTNMSWPAVLSFKLDEVTKHSLDVPFGFAGGYFFLNKEAYAKLPEVARKAIDTYSGEPLSKKLGNGGLAINKEVIAKLRAQPDRTIANLTPEEMARWRKLLQPVVDEWVKSTPDGPKVLAAFEDELKKIRAESR
jgi:TRAP-type C4-dicarboxylate transport system substrate-binding protein